MRLRLILLPVLAAGVLPAAGCGESGSPVPTGPVAPSTRTAAYEFPQASMSLRLPDNLQVDRDERLPSVFRAGAGGAVRVRLRLPPGGAAAAQPARAGGRPPPAGARRRAGATAATAWCARAPPRSTGREAIELLGEQTLGRNRLRIRSLHVYRGRAEYVIEVAAPRRQFARFDRGVTPVIERTLDVRRPRRAAVG